MFTPIAAPSSLGAMLASRRFDLDAAPALALERGDEVHPLYTWRRPGAAFEAPSAGLRAREEPVEGAAAEVEARAKLAEVAGEPPRKGARCELS